MLYFQLIRRIYRNLNTVIKNFILILILNFVLVFFLLLSLSLKKIDKNIQIRIKQNEKSPNLLISQKNFE